MIEDVECPYCHTWQEINHDDGFGCTEDILEEMECSNSECEKTFVFTTSISFYYSASKADCLNGSEHNYKKTTTVPICATKWRCTDCGDEKPLDKDDPMLKIPIYPNGPLITG